MNRKQARNLPHLNFSPQEWFFSTRTYSLEARGLLIDLAAVQWMRGYFPDDRNAVGRMLSCEIGAQVWEEVKQLFISVDGGVGLKWIEAERSAAMKRVKTAVSNGSRGGKASASKRKQPSSHPQATLEGGSSDPQAKSNQIRSHQTGLDQITSDQTGLSEIEDDASLSGGEVKMTTDQIAAIAKSPKKAKWLKAVNDHCSDESRNSLYRLIFAWPDIDAVWDLYSRAKGKANTANSPGAYWATCIKNADAEIRRRR